jgi:hypothetical protein
MTERLKGVLTMATLTKKRKTIGKTLIKGKTLFIPKSKEAEKTFDGNPISESERSSNHAPRRNKVREMPKIKSKNKHKLALRALESEFPKVFNLSFPKPLSIGIRDELLSLNTSVSNKQIRLGLFFYCNSHQYLRCIKAGVNRVNSTGRYVKEVTADEEKEANKRLRSLFAKIKKSR